MGFNADAYRAAHPPWSITLDGRTYVAAWASVEDVKRFYADKQEAKTDAAVIHALYRLLRVLFPARFVYLVRGDPVRKILALPPPDMHAVVADFFAWWVRTVGASLTTGTSSSPPTLSETPTTAPP